MLLTYGFTIGVTDWIFATYTGTGGLDWKVKFFTFVLLMAVGVDYNIVLVSRLRQELREHGLKEALVRSIGHTGSLITSAAAITICSYLAFLVSPLHSLRALGFAVALGITIDALVVRTVIMPCGHYLMFHASEAIGRREAQEECDEKHGALP
jgi:RND superfamily putative drug exporter